MTDDIQDFQNRKRSPFIERMKLDALPSWTHGIGIGGSLVILLIFIAIFFAFRTVNVWEGWEGASELRDPSYNETIHEHSVFRTRMNTWSNLAYITVGLYMIALGIYDAMRNRGLVRGYVVFAPALSILFGVMMIYLGLGSGFFHASLTRWGQQCDVGGMYATMFMLGALCVGSWFPRVPGSTAPTWPLWAVLVIAGSIYFFIYKWSYGFGDVTRPINIMLLAFVIIGFIQRKKHLQVRYFVAAFITIIAGAYIRELDIRGTFSHPDSIWQGHAVWHAMSALFFVLLYLYFRSEEREILE